VGIAGRALVDDEPLRRRRRRSRRDRGQGPHIMRATGTSRRRPPPRCGTAGCAPVTWPRPTTGACSTSWTRKKDMIISGGFNVYPKEVEATLFGHPAVKGRRGDRVPDQVGESVKAVVVRDPAAAGGRREADRLRQGAASGPCSPPRRWTSSTPSRSPRWQARQARTAHRALGWPDRASTKAVSGKWSHRTTYHSRPLSRENVGCSTDKPVVIYGAAATRATGRGVPP